uniref:BolA family transcriptional regulator n=1 Tax=Macrostomum lignano TaxID=282301 RepID=A0A1I8H8C6_9PLAT
MSSSAAIDEGYQGPLASKIRAKLSAELAPSHLLVINESAGHGAGPTGESHFKVVVVSDRFASVARLRRHRMVNDSLAEELNTQSADHKQKIHALSIVAKTPEEWAASDAVPATPPCGGGGGR